MLTSALSQSAALLSGVALVIFGALKFNRSDAREAVDTMKVIVDEQAEALDRKRAECKELLDENRALKMELVAQSDELHHLRRRG